MRDTSTTPYASGRTHVKSGSFVLNEGMPGSYIGDNPGKTGMVGRHVIILEYYVSTPVYL